MVPLMDNRVTIVECPAVEGFKCAIQQIKMPMMMSNRSVVNIYYLYENEDGSIVFLSSSRGSDEIVAAQAATIKKSRRQ